MDYRIGGKGGRGGVRYTLSNKFEAIYNAYRSTFVQSTVAVKATPRNICEFQLIKDVIIPVVSTEGDGQFKADITPPASVSIFNPIYIEVSWSLKNLRLGAAFIKSYLWCYFAFHQLSFRNETTSTLTGKTNGVVVVSPQSKVIVVDGIVFDYEGVCASPSAVIKIGPRVRRVLSLICTKIDCVDHFDYCLISVDMEKSQAFLICDPNQPVTKWLGYVSNLLSRCDLIGPGPTSYDTISKTSFTIYNIASPDIKWTVDIEPRVCSEYYDFIACFSISEAFEHGNDYDLSHDIFKSGWPDMVVSNYSRVSQTVHILNNSIQY